MGNKNESSGIHKNGSDKRSTGNSTIGTVYSSDVCIVTGISNGRTQILYPVSGGNSYKLGWVTGTYNFSSKTQTVIPDGTYKLVSALDNNYVADISGGSSASFTRVMAQVPRNLVLNVIQMDIIQSQIQAVEKCWIVKMVEIQMVLMCGSMILILHLHNVGKL